MTAAGAILLVEDNEDDVFLMKHALTSSGVANPVFVVETGQQAIDYLQGAGKFADRGKFPFPSLVLLDVKLPYVMGLDVLRWIRQQRYAALTVIMLSASAQESDIAAAYRLGANAFLCKPSEAKMFDEMVKALKDFWLTHKTLPEGSSELRFEGVVTLGHATAPHHAEAFPPADGVRRRVWPEGSEAIK